MYRGRFSRPARMKLNRLTGVILVEVFSDIRVKVNCFVNRSRRISAHLAKPTRIEQPGRALGIFIRKPQSPDDALRADWIAATKMSPIGGAGSRHPIIDVMPSRHEGTEILRQAHYTRENIDNVITTLLAITPDCPFSISTSVNRAPGTSGKASRV